MKASEAKALSAMKSKRTWAEQLAGEVQASETPIDVLVDAAWDLLTRQIVLRCETGRTTLMAEPFSLIPGNLFTFEQSSEMADKLVERLQREGYAEVSWDHRDQRVVLQFGW